MKRRKTIFLGALLALVALGLVGVAVTCAPIEPRGPTLPTGVLAPAFSLEAHTGGSVALAELLADGPAVLVFYRGYW